MAAHPASQASSGATHYEILGLAPDMLISQPNPSKLVKQAYHRTLLRNHPDKTTSTASYSFYTVDQISNAFSVLSSPVQRAAYDASLRTQRAAHPAAPASSFQTGVENVDLDDLDFDEALECWFRSCRCGNERGYLFYEADLVDAGDDGELMVGCDDCSLWLRVHFAVLDDEEQEGQVRVEASASASAAATISTTKAQVIDNT